jgi:hypothetical protein
MVYRADRRRDPAPIHRVEAKLQLHQAKRHDHIVTPTCNVKMKSVGRKILLNTNL